MKKGRTRLLTVRMHPDEMASLRRLAAHVGLSCASYLRMRIKLESDHLKEARRP